MLMRAFDVSRLYLLFNGDIGHAKDTLSVVDNLTDTPAYMKMITCVVAFRLMLKLLLYVISLEMLYIPF